MSSQSTTTATDEKPAVELARGELQQAVPEAAEVMRDLLDAEDERIQLKAAQAVLDRAGITEAKATTTRSAEISVGGEEKNDSGLPW
ncbi:hypothetical protein [Haladaptatus sp. NG-WS-4]